MDFIVYKTTNLQNGRIYIGVHLARQTSDFYLGSGHALLEDVRQIGANNFRRETIAVFDNPHDALKLESELVTEDFVSNAATYNLKKGGGGRWVSELKRRHIWPEE